MDDQQSKLFCIVLVTLLAIALGISTPTQISEKNFFTNYIHNTTQIDTYGNQSAYIYLGNHTRSDYFINLRNETRFHEELERYNYTHDILPQIKTTTTLDLIVIGICIACFAALQGGRFSRNNCSTICSSDKVSLRLSDVAGLEYNKKEVFEFVDFVKNREKYAEIGARMPRGAIFYGLPGTGKTMIAKAVAGECGVPFISAAGPDFCELYVGVGSARIRDLFKKARKKAPCIVFIDEIDALGGVRGGYSAGNQERDNTLNRFLIELDGFSDNDQILVFAATNRIDILDKALLRPGRFDRKIRFDLPERKDREAIFKCYLERLNLSGSPTKLAKLFAKRSLGFSGADISNICNEASILAVRGDSTTVTRAHLEQAVDDVLMGPAKGGYTLSDNDRRTVSYHEAGHSVISQLFEHASSPIKVSIIPRAKGSLGFSQSETKETKLKRKEEILDQICVLLGGRVAEEIFCDTITTGASSDIQRSTELAYKYVTIYGMDDSVKVFHYDVACDNYSEKLRQGIDESVVKIIGASYDRVRASLLTNRRLVENMAKALLNKETLLEEDIKRIFS